MNFAWIQQSYEPMCCVCICVGLTQKWTHAGSEIHMACMMSFHHMRDLKRNWHNSRWLGLPLPYPINVPSLECPPDLVGALYQWGCAVYINLQVCLFMTFLFTSHRVVDSKLGFNACWPNVWCLNKFTFLHAIKYGCPRDRGRQHAANNNHDSKNISQF